MNKIYKKNEMAPHKLMYKVSSRFTYEIYSEGGPSMYIYCVVCYVIAVLSVRSVGRVCAHLYTLVDESEHPCTI